ncbi:hypothetical protein D3C83_187190 [compost metagenome]
MLIVPDTALRSFRRSAFFSHVPLGQSVSSSQTSRLSPPPSQRKPVTSVQNVSSM